MSYILDALRKSETERSLGDYAPAKDPAFDISDRSPSRLRSATVVAAVGAVIGLGLFWVFSSRPVEVVATLKPASPPVVSDGANSQSDNSALPPGQAHDLVRETVVPPVATVKKPLAAPPAKAIAKDDAVKFLRAMPASFRSRLPKLEINIHVFSPEQSQQILFINNHEVRPGQRVDGGAILEQITTDGAILRLDNTRFKLPRPS